MFKIKKKSIYLNYKMSKNPVSYGLIAGILGGLGFLGYKLFNDEDADQETIDNAKRSVSFNILDSKSIKKIESYVLENQSQEESKQNLSDVKETNNVEDVIGKEDTEVSINEVELKETKTETNTETKTETNTETNTETITDIEIEAEEISLEPESEKKNVFQRQDSVVTNDIDDTIGRIVSV